MANIARLMTLRVSNNNKPSSPLVPSSSPAAARFSCVANGGHNGIIHADGEKRINNNISGNIDREIMRKQMVAPAKAALPGSLFVMSSTAAPPPEVVVPDLASLADSAKHALILLVKLALRPSVSLRKIHFQLLFEKAIIDCRFFSLFAVAGSLLGSVLCFFEGCFLVLETYIQYFHALAQKIDQGHVMQLLIEAIDMFLVGTAMFIFGVGLYSMFVGSKSLKDQGPLLAGSNLFGFFYMKRVPTWVEMGSISEAKSKLGHAVMMILQVGVLEKFRSVPLVTPLDLACFAATVFISSACIFLLSKLPFTTKPKTKSTSLKS